MSLNLDIVGKKLEPVIYKYNEDKVILYALGIGAGVAEIDFVYEKNLKVYPTFAVVPFMPALLPLIAPAFKQAKPSQMIYYSHQPAISTRICEVCNADRICIDRCRATALSFDVKSSLKVDTDRCIGCGICATACPEKAIEMKSRPGIPEVPVDDQALYAEWAVAAQKLDLEQS